jgi:hypothetical protein
MFTKGAKLEDLMNIAHGVTNITPSQVKKKVEAPIKTNVVKHKPSPSFTTDYMLIMDHNGKLVVKYCHTVKYLILGCEYLLECVYPSLGFSRIF